MLEYMGRKPDSKRTVISQVSQNMSSARPRNAALFMTSCNLVTKGAHNWSIVCSLNRALAEKPKELDRRKIERCHFNSAFYRCVVSTAAYEKKIEM